MAESKNSFLSTFASTVTSTGTITPDAISGNIGISVYDSAGELPRVNLTAGDQAFTSNNGRLYISNGSGWYNIALINNTPTVQSILDSDGGTTPFVLSSEGVVTTITITATDSDGDTLTYSAVADSDFGTMASISQESNVFTITPFGQDSAVATSGTVTFSVTDGINIATPAAQTFTLSFGTNWAGITEQQKIASGVSESFGIAVAIDGDTAVIGALTNPDQTIGAGAAYVYTRSAGVWSLQQKIYASDAAADDRFGNAVAISGDTIIVGAKEEDTGGTATGSAYIFTRSGTTWTQQALLRATGASDGDYFGWAVDIEGDIAVVGAPRDDQPVSNAGAVYVYTRSGSTWTLRQKINRSSIPGNATNFQFGQSTSISGDTLVIGAQDNPNQLGIQYVYVTADNGLTWTEQASFRADDGAIADQMILSKIDGDTIVAGAHRHNSLTGAAYVFTRSGTTWTQQAKIQASDAAANDRFGLSVEIVGDTIVIGAPGAATVGTGSAYIFTRNGTTWTQQAKIQASDGGADDRFGGVNSFGNYGSALNGTTVIIGASGKNAAYVFDA